MGPDPSGWSRRWIVFLLWIALASVANGFVSNTNQQQQSQQQPQQQQNQQSGSQKLPKPPQAPKSPKDFVTTISGDGGPPIGLTNVGTPGTSTFTPVFLTDSEAVCNDGSQAAYYWAPGSGSSTDLWIVYLEGAMFCWSQASCSDRYGNHRYYMSSKAWYPQFAQGGIFATDGSSPWGAANRVYVKYCSSDLWSGDADASPETWNWNFKGSRIVVAVINDLMQTQGLGKSPAKLLFGGCSAGAIGAMNNLEVVAQMVPSTVQVKGFLDGAGLLNIPAAAWTWSPELETLPEIMAEMLAVTNPQFPSYCQQKYPGELWKCLIGEYRFPLITSVPYFVNVPQFDMFNLMYNTDNYEPDTPQQMQYAELFQTGTLSLISTLPPGTGVFSPTCLVHCLSGQTPFSLLQVDGITMSQALSSWYFNNQQTSVVSNCQGWNCIYNCGINQDTGLPCNLPAPNCVQVQLQKDPTPNNWQEPPLLMPPWPTASLPPPPQTEQQTIESIAETKLQSLAAIVKGAASQAQSPPPQAPNSPQAAQAPQSSQQQQQQQQGSEGQGQPPSTPGQVDSSSAGAAGPAAGPAPGSASGQEAAATEAEPADGPPAPGTLARAGSASAAAQPSASAAARDLVIGLAVAGLVAGCVLLGIRGGASPGSGQSAGERVALLQKKGVGAAIQDEATAIGTSLGLDVRRRGHDDNKGSQPFSSLGQQQL